MTDDRPGFARAPEGALRPRRDRPPQRFQNDRVQGDRFQNDRFQEERPLRRDRPQFDQPMHERAPVRPRLALDYTGGETQVAGDREVSSALAHALDTELEDRDRLTHGFHTYPARMHWATAARVIEAFGRKGDHVVDPFCGSGTVLVEARIQGLSSTGIDLNPLAVHLARVKAEPMDAARRAILCQMASELRELSEERVQSRDPIRANLHKSEIGWYDTHVLKEMAGLLEEIRQVEDDQLREALTLVFSSLVVKFSRQRSDTSTEMVEKRLRKGLVSEFFERKAHELAERLGDLENEITGPAPRVIEGDARDVADLISRRADLIVTSPPYGGTYDYVAHHKRRFAWLEIDPREFERAEIGARRRGDDPERFERELYDMLRAFRAALKPGGLAVILMGDARHDDEIVPADEMIADLAEQVGFTPVAVASQTRREPTGGPPRREHLMALRSAR